MPKIEVEESDFLSSSAVTGVVNQMLAHPESRKLLLQARKIADPRAVIPEIDAAAPLNADMAAIRQELAAEREERRRERQEASEARQIEDFSKKWDRQKIALTNKGWSDEGVARVEAFAQENGIGDLSIAADAWEKRNPPPEPVQPSGSGSWGFFEQPTDGEDVYLKRMMESQGNSEQALNAEIAAALNDVRSQNPIRR